MKNKTSDIIIANMRKAIKETEAKRKESEPLSTARIRLSGRVSALREQISFIRGLPDNSFSEKDVLDEFINYAMNNFGAKLIANNKGTTLVMDGLELHPRDLVKMAQHFAYWADKTK